MNHSMESILSFGEPALTTPTADDTNDQTTRRKRQRLSLVCSYCKRRKIKCDRARPHCSSCIRLGIECQYEAPHWVNASLQNNSTLEMKVTRGSEFNDKTREELCKMIYELKDSLEAARNKTQLERTLNTNMSVSMPSSATSMGDSSSSTHLNQTSSHDNVLDSHAIDFFQPYNSLSLKGSSHEDHKPLCSFAIHKKDHYQAFFTCYLFLTLKLNSLFIHDLFRDDYRSKHTDGGSKWLLLLDTKDETTSLKDTIQRIISDRASLFRMAAFPFMSINDSYEDNVNKTVELVLKHLPSKETIEGYLDFYWNHMWSIRPYIDREMFESDINRIIVRDNQTGKVSLNLSQRSDFAVMASLLIIMRYSYTSMSLISLEELDEKYKSIQKSPISVDLITAAETCLCFYRISRKTTLPIIQAFLFLRAYHRDAPEDGDGIALFQSQNLFGFILQSALQMGLNRDPNNYSQTANNIQEANLRRRLWHSIVTIDAYQSILAGTISTLPDPSVVDVHFPMIVSVDPMEHTERDILIRASALNEMYFKISKMVNSAKEKCNLHELLKLIHQSGTYVETHFSLDKMTKLENYPKDSKAYYASLALNGGAIAHNLVQACMELQIYFSLCIHYESNSNLNVVFYKKFFEEVVKKGATIYDLSAAYLQGDFKDYVTQAFNFEILPILNSALYRCLSVSLSGILRAYHAQELILTPMHKNKQASSPSAFDQFVKVMTAKCKYMIGLFKSKLAMRYYQSMKATAYLQYAITCLTAHKFKPMNTIIKFLESNDKYDIDEEERMTFSSAKRDDIKKRLQMDKSLINIHAEWMQVSNFTSGANGDQETSQIVNINNSNMFLEFTEEELTAHLHNHIKFKWSKGLPNFDMCGEVHVPDTSNGIVLDYPKQEQLQNLNVNGALKSFSEFDFFEQNMTDDDFFKNLLDDFDMTGTDVVAVQPQSLTPVSQVPQNINEQAPSVASPSIAFPPQPPQQAYHQQQHILQMQQHYQNFYGSTHLAQQHNQSQSLPQHPQQPQQPQQQPQYGPDSDVFM